MTLLELLGLLRKNIKLVVALPLVCAVVMALVSVFVLPKVYTAETSVYALVGKTGSSATMSDASSEDLTYQDLQSSQLLANDFASLAESTQIRSTVAKNLGLKNLNGYKVAVVSTTNSRLLTISVTGADPEVAPAIANELATVVGETAVDIMGVEAVNVVNEADSPAPRSGPPRKLYTLAAFVAGLIAAIAIVVLRDMLNTTVRSDDEVQQLTDLPVIGRFPYERGVK